MFRASIPLSLMLAVVTSCGPSIVLPAPTPTATSATQLPVMPTASSTASSSGWRRIPDIPTPRSEVAAAVHQMDTVYVVGGFGGRARVERYFAGDKRWERVADLPHEVDHAMAAAVSGLQSSADQGVFVFGGNTAGGATARSFRFDPRAGSWSEIAPMPSPRAAGAAVALGPDIYIVGGADGSRLVAPTHVYNLTTRTWRTVAPIPTPRDHLAAVELNARACAVGGRRLSMSANLATLECYDPRAQAWVKMPDAPTARGGVGAAVYNDRLYFVGGEQPSGTFKEVEIYDARTGTWSRGPDLPTPRHGLALVAVGGTSNIASGTLLALTGGPTPGGSQTAVCEALTLD